MKVNGKFVPENKIILTDEQVMFIHDNFYSMTNQQIADALGLKITALRMKMYAMGLKRMELEYWTEEQIEILVNHFHYIGDKELAEIFDENYYKEKGWTRKHIEKKRRYMKLKRTEEMKRAIKEREVAKGTYIIGNQKMWQTRGAKPIGTIVQWGDQSHIYIKNETGKYELFNRKIWTEHYGEIPPNMNVVRIDHTADWTIDNMILMTNSELAIRNAEIRNTYPPELKQLIKINNKLTKKIKQHEQT
jgi:hypothetical protein